jgi:hypothetical protein
MFRKHKLLVVTAPYLLFLGILGLIFSVTLFPGPGRMIFGNDIYDYQYFHRINYQKSLKNGQIPFWNPYQFAGYPAAANPQGYNVFYPGSLIFLLMPVPQAMAWFLMLHIFLAMVGMFRLMRRFTGQAAALAAALSFGLSGFFLPRVYAGHIDFIAAAAYLPWIFAAFWDLFLVGSQFHKFLYLKIIFLLTLQILTGYLTAVMYTAELGLLLAIILSAIKRRLFPVVRVILAYFLASFFAAVQLLPNLEFLSRVFRAARLPYSWAEHGSLTSAHFGQLLYGWWRDFRIHNLPRPVYPEHILYFGAIPLVFAFLAIVTTVFQRKSFGKKTRFLTFYLVVVMGFSLWISFGANAGFDLNGWLWNFVPGYKLFRIPPRHLLLFIFAGAALGGLGMDLIRNRAIRFVFIALLAGELTVFARHYVDYDLTPEVANDPVVRNFLTSQRELVRFLPNYVYTVRLGNTYDFDAPTVDRIYSASGFDPMILGNYYEFFSRGLVGYDPNKINGIGQAPVLMTQNPGGALDFLNIRYYLGQGDATLFDPAKPGRFIVRLTNPGRWSQIIENTAALPRFYLAPQAIGFSSREELMDAVALEKINYATTVGLVKPSFRGLKTAECLDGKYQQVEVALYESERVVIRTAAICDTYLVSSEVNYPGWQTKIDGAKVPTLEANGAFRAVFVPAGSHEVEFRFHPVIFLAGGLISISSTITFGVYMLISANIFLSKNSRPATSLDAGSSR